MEVRIKTELQRLLQSWDREVLTHTGFPFRGPMHNIPLTRRQLILFLRLNPPVGAELCAAPPTPKRVTKRDFVLVCSRSAFRVESFCKIYQKIRGTFESRWKWYFLANLFRNYCGTSGIMELRGSWAFREGWLKSGRPQTCRKVQLEKSGGLSRTKITFQTTLWRGKFLLFPSSWN